MAKVLTIAPNASLDESLTETILTLWRRVLARRAPGVIEHLDGDAGKSLPGGNDAIPFLQALTVRYQLLRIVDENQVMRRRRALETTGGSAAIPQSFAELFSRQNNGRNAIHVSANTIVSPTFTAHPTETKRVTVLEIHRRIYRGIVSLETERWTPRERQSLVDEIENNIDLLWFTGELRIDRPTPKDEIDWGLHYFRDILFDVVPDVCASLNRAVEEQIGEFNTETIPQLRFHSWIGGDRDGNPHVTTDVTRQALKQGQSIVLVQYEKLLTSAAAQLSISGRIAPLQERHMTALQKIIGVTPAASQNVNEPFRQVLTAINSKIQTSDYLHISDLVADLKTVESALASLDADMLSKRYIRPIRWFAEIYGFRTVTLDIRQNSTVTNTVLQELWSLLDDGDAPEQGSKRWSKKLRDELSSENLQSFNLVKLSEQGQELFNLLGLMREVISGPDPKAVGPFILSMTQSADDLAAVLLLARYAGFERECPEITVVPLFETIADLRAAPEILRKLISVPIARRCLTRNSKAIEVMLGYSDSNKDGGFICSSWEVHCAQTRIVSAMSVLGLEVTFFHGRGGSVSRGGAPSHRAIGAQPPGTIGKSIRLTEQGEVLSAHYANRGTAAAHLELLLSSSIQHRLRKPAEQPKPEYDDTMATLAGLSETAYRSLITSEGFLDYFQQASPVEELASLKIGSRPAKRFGANTLDDLRAIPWVFAWSQNRHLLTGWYGFGTAIEDFVSIRGSSAVGLLRQMFKHSEFFRLVVDETEKTLFQTDLTIASEYSTLVKSQVHRETLLAGIDAEYQKSLAAIELVTESSDLAVRFPDFRADFSRYSEGLDRVHYLQIDLLREVRSGDRQSAVSIPLLQSMNCISSALGWTG